MRFLVGVAVALACVSSVSGFLSGSGSAGIAAKVSRSGAAVCSLRAAASEEGSVSRRELLGSAVAFAAALALPATRPVFAEEYKISGDYKTDVEELLGKMKAATELKKGDPEMKNTVEEARKEMNTFVAYYRRNNKVAGAASFSTLYTAISTLSGHFQNYGPEYPVPEKRKKRLAQQYADIEKQLARGR